MSGVDDNPSVDTRRHFLQALRRVLRPIVRLMIRSGIRYDEFVDVARGAYVESAIRDADRSGPRPTRDQVAWITGIRRELVDHYIDSYEPLSDRDLTSRHVEADALHRWHTDARYLGPTGAPLELEFDAPEGISFKELVAQSDSEADPKLILDNLLRAGSVSRLDKDIIRPLSRFFIWREQDATQISALGFTVAHMIETHEHNLCSRSPQSKRLERTVATDRGISEKLLPSFHAFARERCEQFLIDVDDWLGQRSLFSDRHTGQCAEVGLNVFFYVEPPVDVTPITSLVQPNRTTSSSNKRGHR